MTNLTRSAKITYEIITGANILARGHETTRHLWNYTWWCNIGHNEKLRRQRGDDWERFKRNQAYNRTGEKYPGNYTIFNILNKVSPSPAYAGVGVEAGLPGLSSPSAGTMGTGAETTTVETAKEAQIGFPQIQPTFAAKFDLRDWSIVQARCSGRFSETGIVRVRMLPSCCKSSPAWSAVDWTGPRPMKLS